METVVKLIIVLVFFSFVLKLTGYKPYQLLVAVLACVLFTGFSWSFAVQQSRTEIASWLSDRGLMQDMAVVLTIDVVLQMTYCLMAVNLMGSGVLKRSTIWIYRLLRAFPGIMVFLVLFGLLVSCVFAFPGVPFMLISWGMAVAVLIVVPLAVFLVRKLLPEKEIRLELLFLSNALTAALGIIATVNGTTVSGSAGSIDGRALAAVFAIVMSGAVLGFLLYRLKLRRNRYK